jgi:hypothetical protein
MYAGKSLYIVNRGYNHSAILLKLNTSIFTNVSADYFLPFITEALI